MTPSITKKKLFACLKKIKSRSFLNERERIVCWATLDAWRTHFPSTLPRQFFQYKIPKSLDPNRFIKNRRLAIVWLTKYL